MRVGVEAREVDHVGVGDGARTIFFEIEHGARGLEAVVNLGCDDDEAVSCEALHGTRERTRVLEDVRPRHDRRIARRAYLRRWFGDEAADVAGRPFDVDEFGPDLHGVSWVKRAVGNNDTSSAVHSRSSYGSGAVIRVALRLLFANRPDGLKRRSVYSRRSTACLNSSDFHRTQSTLDVDATQVSTRWSTNCFAFRI